MANKKKYAPGEKRPRGMRADGRYSGRVTVGHDADGKAVVKTVYGRTRAELEANRAKVKAQYTGDARQTRKDMLFGAYVEQFYAAYVEPELSDASKRLYQNLFDVHLLPAFGDRQLRSISAMDLQNWLNQQKDYSKSMIDKLHMAIKRIFRTAAAQGYIDFNPADALQKPRSRQDTEGRRALTPREREAALHVMDTHPDGLLLRVLYCTGLRRGEALAITGSDIDLDAGTITICSDIDFMGEKRSVGALKTAAAHRVVPIPPLLRGALERAQCGPDDFLIHAKKPGEPLTLSAYMRRWDNLMMAMYDFAPDIAHKTMPILTHDARGKTVTGSILTAHYFRHNYATELYNAGVDLVQAMAWMGHSDIKTLIGVYTHLTPATAKRNAKKLAKVFSATEKM